MAAAAISIVRGGGNSLNIAILLPDHCYATLNIHKNE
jgi:hypothetical protein